MTPHGNDGQRGGAAPAPQPHNGYRASLLGLQQRGYCTDEWSRWQQGQCGTYAVALMGLRPQLRFGTLGITRAGGGDASSGWTPEHHFAHDDTYAYDSAGRHPLPYRGVYGDADYYELDGNPGDWARLSEEGSGEPDIAAAQEHARRHRILDGGYGPSPGPDQGAASGLTTGPEFLGPPGVRRPASPGRRAPGSATSASQAIIQDKTDGKTTWTGRTKAQLVAALARKGWSRDSVRNACHQAACDGSATTTNNVGDLAALVTFGDTEVDLWDAEVKPVGDAALRRGAEVAVTALAPVSAHGSAHRARQHDPHRTRGRGR